MDTTSIKMTADGQIDYDHYIRQAHQERAKVLAGLLKGIAQRFMGVFKVRSIECLQAKPCH